MISFPYISYHIMREITICNDDFCNYAIIVSIKQLGDVAMRFRLVAFADEAAPDLDVYKRQELRALMEEYGDDISLSHIGFPENWDEMI